MPWNFIANILSTWILKAVLCYNKNNSEQNVRRTIFSMSLLWEKYEKIKIWVTYITYTSFSLFSIKSYIICFAISNNFWFVMACTSSSLCVCVWRGAKSFGKVFAEWSETFILVGGLYFLGGGRVMEFRRKI